MSVSTAIALLNGVNAVLIAAIVDRVLLRHVWPWDYSGRRRELKLKQRDRRW